MTYPQGIPATLRPTDIHDALWGVLSAVYGGAVHPTAEGYAAMADAAMPAARVVLNLPQPPAVSSEALPPLNPAAVPSPPPAGIPAQPPAGAPAAPPAAVPAPTAAPAPAPQPAPAPLTIVPPPAQ